MSAILPMQTPRPSLRKLCAAHIVLAVVMSAWRILESTPRSSSLNGAQLTATFLGRALTMLSVLAGVAALAVVIVSTYRSRRDWRALVLCAALAAALGRRDAVDVFDIVYWLVVALFAVLTFGRGARIEATRS